MIPLFSILGFLAGLYVWIVCRVYRPRHLQACGSTHEMVITGTRQMKIDAMDYTIALYRCRSCYVHSSMLHQGNWELDDFLRTETEAEEMNRKFA